MVFFCNALSVAADLFSSAFVALEEVEGVSAAVLVVAEVRARLAGGAWDAASSSSN